MNAISIIPSRDPRLIDHAIGDLSQLFLVSLGVSLAICALNIATERWHRVYSFDTDTTGVQKVHKRGVPRTGGLALVTGVAVVPLLAALDYQRLEFGAIEYLFLLKLWLAAMPAFLTGICEDLSKRVSVRTRFCSIVASAVLAAWMLGARLPRVDIWGVDAVLGLLPVSLVLTVFAVAGVSNAINIIDGFNGVAGATVAIVLAGMALLGWREGDGLVVQLALAGLGATLGFLLLNYPTGRLFMGDGGAYFLGFWAAETAVLAIVRNPGINAWQVLAMFAYPVTEVLFSMYRRKILRDSKVGAPDRLHLHSLFYRRVARQRLSATRFPWMCNAGVACFVTSWMASATLAALLWGNTVGGAALLVLVQLLAYVAIYMRLVRGHWGHCRHPAVLFGLRPATRLVPA
ncbi:glycosyltransferase [Massilia sp. 9I]|uniref:MraY family glycosyltransferase n=1 Tax=Massilia sp. 9I TaxID=2653152 RepID=UPI0012F08316|nr:glycosyltransferase [Massilia sp. 9I]VXB89131.1 Glycosyl transferase 4 family protein [Massilia sp. 9I]